MSYATAAEICEAELLVKKSRFIARVVPVMSRGEALAAVQASRNDYPDARHHCWAYLLGNPIDASSAGMNDDGEPSGTAGKPIFNVMQHSDLGDILVIVIRYFGGVKLGAGGLVRAYGQATQQVLEQVQRHVHVELRHYQLEFGFALEQPLRHWLQINDGQLDSIEYGATVVARISLAPEMELELQRFVAAHGFKLQQD